MLDFRNCRGCRSGRLLRIDAAFKVKVQVTRHPFLDQFVHVPVGDGEGLYVVPHRVTSSHHVNTVDEWFMWRFLGKDKELMAMITLVLLTEVEGIILA